MISGLEGLFRKLYKQYPYSFDFDFGLIRNFS